MNKCSIKKEENVLTEKTSTKIKYKMQIEYGK